MFPVFLRPRQRTAVSSRPARANRARLCHESKANKRTAVAGASTKEPKKSLGQNFLESLSEKED